VKAVRLILTAFILFWLTQSAFACLVGRRVGYDWADVFSPARAAPVVGDAYFVGKVNSIQEATDASGKRLSNDGTVKFEVLKTYRGNVIEHTEIQVYAPWASCGDALTVGQIGLFVFETVDGKRTLRGYTHKSF
jgi:hypothetical protein